MGAIKIRTSDLRILHPSLFDTDDAENLTFIAAARVSLGSVSTKDIEDKSKSDKFLRMLACL